MASAKLSDFAATAKAWVAAAIAGLTGLSAFIVPESTVGVVVTSAVAFLVALLGVFGKSNADPKPEPARDSFYNGPTGY